VAGIVGVRASEKSFGMRPEGKSFGGEILPGSGVTAVTSQHHTSSLGDTLSLPRSHPLRHRHATHYQHSAQLHSLALCTDPLSLLHLAIFICCTSIVSSICLYVALRLLLSIVITERNQPYSSLLSMVSHPTHGISIINESADGLMQSRRDNVPTIRKPDSNSFNSLLFLCCRYC
jgi:hypothetical protein